MGATDHDHSAKRLSSSSLVISNSNEPEPRRGSFIQFVEESGSNKLLIEAIQRLYEEPEKPDSPLKWLASYFRKLAPKRKAYLDETKSSLRNELINLENMILIMREEEVAKQSKIEKLCTPQCSRGKGAESSYQLPDQQEYEANPKVRVDTRWRIAPHPCFRATCSQEQQFLAKRLTDGQEEGPKPQDKKDEYVGVIDLDQDQVYASNSVHGLNSTVIFNRDLSDSPKMNTEEEISDADAEEEDPDWIKNYNIYRKTSQLPSVTRIKSTPFSEPTPTSLSTKATTPFVLTTAETPGEDSEEKVLNPDSLPRNYWKPGFTLHPHDDECSSGEESISDGEEDVDDAIAHKDPENYYRPSRGPNSYMKRPFRPDIIYEHYWQLCQAAQSDLPGKNDMLSRVKFGPILAGVEPEREGNVPSVNSVNVSNSVRNWFMA